MIPYEDLVNALTAWRAKKGLPVAQQSNTWAPPPPVAAPPVATAPKSTPPSAPPKSAAPAVVPPPLARPSEESLDVDDASLIEEAHYENEGDDFALAFGATAPAHDGESTAIGGAPRADAHAAPGHAPHAHAGHDFGGETLLGEHDLAPEHTHDEAADDATHDAHAEHGAAEDDDKNPIEW